MNISVISGSRADFGLLQWPTKLLKEDPFFSVAEVNIWGHSAASALQAVSVYLEDARPDYILILGDRYEILSAAIAAHLQRIKIAHIGGGDVTQGSYDDAMRDCISRMASLHFATSGAAYSRLFDMGYSGVHLVGNPGVDYIRYADWRRPRSIAERYVVVSYQPETIDDTVDLAAVYDAIAGRKAIWITPNPDRGSEKIPPGVSLSHDDFLNLLVYADEFIGNSSSMLYEAPSLGVRCRMIGKRQQGRVYPLADGKASDRIRDILKSG